MAMNPFETAAVEENTTRMFLCCLHNLSDKNDFDGMMPRDIYNRLGLEAVTGKDAIAQKVQWLVNSCLQSGYIEPVGNTGRIKMTANGHKRCLSGDPVYCSGLPSYKNYEGANISGGIILVTCDGKSSNDVIKESKSLSGVISAYIVDKKTPDAPDVIINMDTKYKDTILNATNILLTMHGVQKVKYQIV
jgi:hypothetical protein